jgi:excinuclease ABC subunit C
VDTVASWLSQLRGAKVTRRVPQRGDKRTLLETVARNAGDALTQHKLRRAGDLTARGRALEEIGEGLGMLTVPLRIECYDVSQIQGTDVVASMVVFEDGVARKSEYRRFIVGGQLSPDGAAAGPVDDVAAITEVLRRRFARYLAARETGEQPRTTGAPAPGSGAASVLESDGAASLLAADASVTERPAIDPETGRPRKFAYAPNLVVVDGGAPQVNAAGAVLREMGIDDIMVCGLAKRLEEVWLPNEPFPLVLPRTSEGLYLLQRVRDEAHRFAITFHRQRRSKRMTASTLDSVPGLGDVRRKALLRRFGSVKRLASASLEEIAEVPGIGRRTAEAVLAALATGRSAPAGSTAESAPPTTPEPAAVEVTESDLGPPPPEKAASGT